jgi:hypothetical protein
MLVNTGSDKFSPFDTRGALVRLTDKPTDLPNGKRLAMKLAKSAAASFETAQLADTQPVTRRAFGFQIEGPLPRNSVSWQSRKAHRRDHPNDRPPLPKKIVLDALADLW